MPVNWKDPNAFTRLLAAMVAAQDMKLDYRKIASMYGNGATYDSIEGRFRIVKKEAAALKAEIDSGERSEAPARGATTTTSANTTPKKPKSSLNTPKKERIMGGRVGKSNGTPAKKRTSNARGMIKEEPDSSNSSFHQTPSVEDVEGSAPVTENGGQNGGVLEGDELSLYYDNDFVDESMDIEAF